MFEKIKITYKSFLAFQYEREAAYYNTMSENGWQLVRAGLFSQKFRADSTVRYRYQLDYRKKTDDFARYLDTFREQGWEYVNSTFNGWHIFRKLYDSALPESEYEIYTDTESVNAMKKRLTVGFSIMTALLLSVISLYGIFVSPYLKLPNVLLGIAYGIMIGVGITGIVALCKKRTKTVKNAKKPRSYLWLLVVFIALGIASNRLNSARPSGFSATAADSGTMWSGSEFGDQTSMWYDTVSYADFYYFDIEIANKNSAALSLVNSESGEVVYSVRGNDFNEKGLRLWLTPGLYRIYMTEFSGGPFKVDFKIH